MEVLGQEVIWLISLFVGDRAKEERHLVSELAKVTEPELELAAPL